MSHLSVRRHISYVQGNRWPLKGEGWPYFLRCLLELTLQKHRALNRCDNGVIFDFLINLRTKTYPTLIKTQADQAVA